MTWRLKMHTIISCKWNNERHGKNKNQYLEQKQAFSVKHNENHTSNKLN